LPLKTPVRFVDAFVASLDLPALGFAKAQCARTGRPPYDPAVLLKLYLYGYLHRVRSSRLLEAECHRNVEVIWLTGKQVPDFKTIADFRKDNLPPLKAVARSFTVLCRKLALFGGELLAIDGSKFAAVNARDQNFNAAKLKELMARADARLAEYLQQLAVDAKHKLIAADDVTNEVNDYQQLANVAVTAKANLELKQTEVVADAGYYNASEVSRCAEHGITTYIPKADTSANRARGLYGKRQFQYDATKDVYVCPAGVVLTYRFATVELDRELKYYRATGCQACPLKSRCTRNQANRTITREANEHLMEQMARRRKAQPGKFKLRKTLAEHPFGTIKRHFGYTHFLLKGLPKVQCEWSLTTLVYNLKRVLNLVSFAKLMAAVA
jgi:transposase